MSAAEIETGILRQEVDCWRTEVARLRCMLSGIRSIVSDALGGDPDDWLKNDVRLLANRCKAAESEVMRLKRVTVLPGMPGAEL